MSFLITSATGSVHARLSQYNVIEALSVGIALRGAERCEATAEPSLQLTRVGDLARVAPDRSKLPVHGVADVDE